MTYYTRYTLPLKKAQRTPTYDRSGYELAYDKVAQWHRPQAYKKSAMVNGIDRALAQGETEEKQMAEIVFENGAAPETSIGHDSKILWKDKVLRDLSFPYHKAGIEQFRECEKKSFPKAKRVDYAILSDADKKRGWMLNDSASMRK